MADLSGSFSSIQLAPLAQFLASLGKSGDLLISNQHWVGQLGLQDGRIVAAGIDDERGLSALELIVSGVSAEGHFEFFDGAPTLTQSSIRSGTSSKASSASAAVPWLAG